ncbi:MAG: MFS transporter [Deltaproteobacteria bacterium]|nr:MFS transporter [Deltaproteobacteria bacterium]
MEPNRLDRQGRADLSMRAPALIVATLANFLTPFMGSSVNIALPAIGAEFGADAIVLSWIPTAFLLAAAMVAIPFGRIADIHGMKRVFLYGVLLFTASSLLSALAPAASWLIVFRVLQGIAGGMIFVTGLAIITSVFPPYERGRAIGINIGTVYISLSLGPVLGGTMTHYLGWRSLFFAMVPLGVTILAVAGWRLKGEWAASRGEAFDWRGSLIYSTVLLTLMSGFSRLPGPAGIVLILLGLAGFAGFIWFELRAESPLLNLRLFRNRTFAFSNLAALINYSANFAVGFLLSLYLQYIKGFDAQSAGLVLVVQPVVQAFFAPVAGRLSDRIQAQRLSSFGMALCTAGLFILTFITAQTGIAMVGGALVFLGLGFAFFSPPNTNAIMGSVERRFYGVASAMVSTMRLVGQMLSMGLALVVFALFIGNVRITPERYPALLASIHTVFLVCTGLCFLGIFISLARGKNQKTETLKGSS